MGIVDSCEASARMLVCGVASTDNDVEADTPVTKVMAMLAADVALKLLWLQLYICSAFCSWCHHYRVAALVVRHSTVP